MSKPNFKAVNATREKAKREAENARINEIARLASDIKVETGCTRTEALRIAEGRIAHVRHV